MATLVEIRSELNRVTELMSGRVLTLNAGVVGSVWAFTINDQLNVDRFLMAALAFALLSFVSDFLQFVFAYIHQRRLEEVANNAVPQTARQDHFPKLWAARFWFFNAKLVLSTLAAGCLAVSAVVSLVAPVSAV